MARSEGGGGLGVGPRGDLPGEALSLGLDGARVQYVQAHVGRSEEVGDAAAALRGLVAARGVYCPAWLQGMEALRRPGTDQQRARLDQRHQEAVSPHHHARAARVVSLEASREVLRR